MGILKLYLIFVWSAGCSNECMGGLYISQPFYARSIFIHSCMHGRIRGRLLRPYLWKATRTKATDGAYAASLPLGR